MKFLVNNQRAILAAYWKADNDSLFEVLIQEVVFLVLLKTKIILQGANDMSSIIMLDQELKVIDLSN
ncbi:hypothetical protein ACJIZ3_016985 [Penstemon smallii]|uniref:Uncharacterized protein n=1 Tax=Penstemon smallii TaxID=265156 RepID=A0ABD3SVG3_9LAMI